MVAPLAPHLAPAPKVRILVLATVGAAFALTAAVTMCATAFSAPNDKRPLTPADAIATVRVMPNQLAPGNFSNPGMTSPSGRRYVIRTAYGDVPRNGVWVDIWTGTLDSLDHAARPTRCAHLMTTGLGSPTNHSAADYDPQPTNLLRWVNDTQVDFLWSDARRMRQVISVDLATCATKFLTHSLTGIFSFVLTPQGAMVYNAHAPLRVSTAPRLLAQGFTVSESSDAWAILNGDFDGKDVADVPFNNQWYIKSPARPLQPIGLDGDRIDGTNPNFRELVSSNTGKYIITHVGIHATPSSWSQYPSPTLQALLETNKTMPHRIPLAYTVVDLRDGSSRLLWDAPTGFRCQVIFAPHTDEALLAPTFLPLAAHNPLGTAGVAAAVVDVATGHYQQIPIDLTDRFVAHMRWLSATQLEIATTTPLGDDPRLQRFRRIADSWTATDLPESVNAPDSADTPATSRGAPIKIEVRQDLNHPPQIFAVDTRSGESRLIFDPNPNLMDRFKLGHVERMSGITSGGPKWLAQLIYPADYVPGHRYPLVIQSQYGKTWVDEEFALDGSWGASSMGLGPIVAAAYPGQLLATRNIAVVELEVLHPRDGVHEAEDYQAAFEGIAEKLSTSGLIDRNRIALEGFSRNGYWVEYTLAHSKFPFAAAIAEDNYDPSYVQSALSNWRIPDIQMNGAPPFGAGLQEWIKHAPGFNADNIHTPLRIIGQTPAPISFIVGEWEIYSRLRSLHKPVEMYLMPDMDKYPSHTPQNPRQILAIQEGAIDWFSFWLAGYEDPNPAKRAQYARWRAFKASQSTGG